MTKVLSWLGVASDRVDRIAVWISILYAFLVSVTVLASVFLENGRPGADLE